MAAVAPLREEQEQWQPERVRPRDLRRQPLQRRPLPKSFVPAPSSAGGTSSRPQLAVVPRRRRAVGIVVMSCVTLFTLCLGAVAFQTRLAQNQLTLDRTERDVVLAKERYDILRRQRAELRSPTRLSLEAARLGMTPAENGEFMVIPADVVAAVAATSSGLPNEVSTKESNFDQFGQVKEVTGDTP